MTWASEDIRNHLRRLSRRSLLEYPRFLNRRPHVAVPRPLFQSALDVIGHRFDAILREGFTLRSIWIEGKALRSTKELCQIWKPVRVTYAQKESGPGCPCSSFLIMRRVGGPTPRLPSAPLGYRIKDFSPALAMGRSGTGTACDAGNTYGKKRGNGSKTDKGVNKIRMRRMEAGGRRRRRRWRSISRHEN